MDNCIPPIVLFYEPMELIKPLQHHQLGTDTHCDRPTSESHNVLQPQLNAWDYNM
jgi:hypothetical protein